MDPIRPSILLRPQRQHYRKNLETSAEEWHKEQTKLAQLKAKRAQTEAFLLGSARRADSVVRARRQEMNASQEMLRDNRIEAEMVEAGQAVGVSISFRGHDADAARRSESNRRVMEDNRRLHEMRQKAREQEMMSDRQRELQNLENDFCARFGTSVR